MRGTLVLAALLLGGCRQTIGIDQYFNAPADAGAGTSACGLPYGTTACAACAQTNCCAESNACATSLACDPYETCLGKCVNGDPQCRSQCTIDHPVGTSGEVSALSACLASKCESACGLSCGAVAAYVSEPASANACQSCVETTSAACTHARACGSSVDCDHYWRCVLACPTADCRLTCATDHAAGAALFAAFQPDYAGSCATPCAYGNYWACVGRVNWPVATSKTYMFTCPVVDFVSHQGVPGLDVLFCTGCPCPTATNLVLARGQTDDAGTIALSIPFFVNASGVPSTFCAQATSPATPPSIVPTFGYWTFPVSEPVLVVTSTAIDLAVPVLTPAAYAQYMTLYGVIEDPTRGQVGALIHDCLGSLAAGVQITSDKDDAGVSVLSPTDAGTTSSGLIVFDNMPAGLVTLTATPKGLGKAASVFTVNVAAGTLTAVSMFPTP